MTINSSRNSTFIVIGAAALFVIIILFQYFNSPDDEYAKNLGIWRNQKDEMFRKDAASPLPDSAKAGFKGLNYYPPTYNWVITADFQPVSGEKQTLLNQSAGEEKNYIQAGKLNFQINGTSFGLMAFYEKENNGQNLFIPFRDLTSGKETYGGGRYLDARLSGKKVILDFNKAYHPYCLFNYSYVCPLPPEGNSLEVAIEAGEKI